MIAEAIAGVFKQLALAALDDYAMLTVVNDGPPARYVVLDPQSGITWSAFVPTGETVKVNRAFRLLVEHIDAVALRPLCVVSQRWSTV